MKFHEYKILHTKKSDGTDIYTILSVYFGFIKLPFSIPRLPTSFDSYDKKEIKYFFPLYTKLTDAKEELIKYTKYKYTTYKGYRLMRCDFCWSLNKLDSWVVLSSRTFSTKIWRFEYNMYGSIDECKKLIDKDIKIKENNKFLEIIDL